MCFADISLQGYTVYLVTFQPGGKKVVGLESAILEIHRFFKTTFTQQSEKKTVTMLQVMYTW